MQILSIPAADMTTMAGEEGVAYTTSLANPYDFDAANGY